MNITRYYIEAETCTVPYDHRTYAKLEITEGLHGEWCDASVAEEIIEELQNTIDNLEEEVDDLSEELNELKDRT